jgi:hypothetical protein
MPAFRETYYKKELGKAGTPEERALLTYKMHNPVRRTRHAKYVRAIADDPILSDMGTLTKEQLLAIYYGHDEALQKALKRQQKARARLVKRAFAFHPPH